MKDTTPTRRTKPGLVPRLLLATAAFLFALLVAELGTRFLRPEPWYEQILRDQQLLSTPPPFRPLGELTKLYVRDHLRQTRKPQGCQRILFLGDSFTFGLGVGKEETFVSIIERCLNEIWSNQGIRKLEVFNGGVPGSYTRHWVKVFARARTEFDPDLVIAVFFLRDGTGPEITSIGMIRQIEQGMRQLERESWLYRHSHLFRLARERQAYQELSKKYLGMIRAGYFGSDEQTTEWYAAQKNLLHIRDTAVSDGRMFAMIIFPVLIDLNEDYPLRDVCETLESFCRKNSIPVLSLLPAFMGEDAPQLWVSAYDQHPNARAHAIAADAILPFVRDLLSKE